MKYLLFLIILAVFKDSHLLNWEILRYDQMLKDFEATGRALKQQDKKMDGSIVKRENSNHSYDFNTTTTASPLLHTYRIEYPLPVTDSDERPFTPYWTQTDPSTKSTTKSTTKSLDRETKSENKSTSNEAISDASTS